MSKKIKWLKAFIDQGEASAVRSELGTIAALKECLWFFSPKCGGFSNACFGMEDDGELCFEVCRMEAE